ncbi:MAG: MoaD/ThiS family protein [Thermoguttaceae bacterium]
MNVSLTMTGRGYPAAEGLPANLTLADGATLDEALQALAALVPAGKAPDGNCLVAVSGRHLGTVRDHQPHVLRSGDELLLMAPMAGG